MKLVSRSIIFRACHLRGARHFFLFFFFFFRPVPVRSCGKVFQGRRILYCDGLSLPPSTQTADPSLPSTESSDKQDYTAGNINGPSSLLYPFTEHLCFSFFSSLLLFFPFFLFFIPFAEKTSTELRSLRIPRIIGTKILRNNTGTSRSSARSPSATINFQLSVICVSSPRGLRFHSALVPPADGTETIRTVERRKKQTNKVPRTRLTRLLGSIRCVTVIRKIERCERSREFIERERNFG